MCTVTAIVKVGKLLYRTRSCKPPGVAELTSVQKVVGGSLHMGVALLYIPLFLRGGWLTGNSVQRHGGGLHEGAAYTTEYGTVLASKNYRLPYSPGQAPCI